MKLNSILHSIRRVTLTLALGSGVVSSVIYYMHSANKYLDPEASATQEIMGIWFSILFILFTSIFIVASTILLVLSKKRKINK